MVGGSNSKEMDPRITHHQCHIKGMIHIFLDLEAGNVNEKQGVIHS